MPASIYNTNGSPRVNSLGDGTASTAAIAPPPPSALAAQSTIHSNLSVKYEFNASALSVDATGSFAVLAGRKGLHLVDLEAPYMPAATLHHQTKWEVAVVKCSPHVQFRGHVASTSNHNTLIWNIASAHGGNSLVGVSKPAGSSSSSSSQPLVATLRAHTRPVSDVAWSPTEPWVLATCSADTKTHLWDLRTPHKPVQTLHAFTSSATCVAWNRVDATSLATAHDGDVRVWDTRSGDRAPPAVTITAHMQKIYGIDWHPTRAYELVTCSEDKSVKFWNVAQPRNGLGMFTTGAPVWRARYTPFGDGLVTSAHRLDSALRLYALAPYSEPGGIAVDAVHTYTGHRDLVRGFVWRARPSTGAFQLVSWAKNQELRLWRVDAQHLEACGYDTAPYSEVAQPAAAELLRSDGVRFQQQQLGATKYDLAALRTDFVPLVVPPTAVPLGAAEYSLDGHADSISALLVFDEDLAKIGEPETSSDDEAADRTTTKAADSSNSADARAAVANSTSTGGSARALPCPRFSGASFSGPNMLLVFDSRVAIGQTRTSAVPAAAAAAGKQPIKPAAVANKLPRTYEELLDLRDSRFATKKNKNKPAAKLPNTSLGAMDMLGGGDWGQHDLLLDNGSSTYYNDDSTAVGSSSLFYSGSSAAAIAASGALEPLDHHDKSVHGGSEYLKTYFATSEFHLPINHPEHRLSMPSAAPGNTNSPRGVGGSTGGGGAATKRLEQAPGAALNLDLSLSVTVLDLSRLCGVSAVLTYASELAPQRIATASSVPPTAATDTALPVLESGSRSLLAWMLQAAERRPARTSSRIHPTPSVSSSAEQSAAASKPHDLSHALQTMLQQPQTPGTNDPVAVSESQLPTEPLYSVSNTCAHNARVASLAGRTDLQQVWSLLEAATAPRVELPMHATAQLPMLASAHPWSAHPFGKRLVDKILRVYEQAGDLPTVASIVCALQPVESSSAGALAGGSSDASVNGGNRVSGIGSDAVGASRKFVTSVSGTTDVGSNTVASSSLDDDVYVLEPSSHYPMRSRRSSNTLSVLGDDDVPPMMKHTRRSMSHNDSARAALSNAVDRSEHSAYAALTIGSSTTTNGLRIHKDWPAASTANRLLSPVRTPSSRMTPRGTSSTSASSAGWRMDFESPFKTWSSSARETSPRRALTHETFQSPVASMPEHAALPEPESLYNDNSYDISHYDDNNDNDNDDDASARIALTLRHRASAADTSLLSTDAADEARYDAYKTAYADLLYRYGATDRRADVLKTVAHAGSEHDGLALALLCHACQTPTDDPVCSACRDFAIKCSVCQLVVRGQSMFCLTCGHGGHAEHLRSWFELESACPTGCGCWCKASTSTTAASPFELSDAPQESVPARSYSF